MTSATPPMTTTTTFAQATTITALTPHTYTANFPDDWCIGSVPHGGYITSCFLRVAQTHFNTTLASQAQPDTIALHLDFLRRTQAGPAEFVVKDVKLGRQASVIHITLSQGEGRARREEVVGYITHGNIAAETGLSLDTKWTLHPAPVQADLSRLAKGTDPNWALQTAMPFASFRKASQKVEFYFPRAGQQMLNVGDCWMRFRSGEVFDAIALGYLVDMFPMPIEAFLSASDGEGNPYVAGDAAQRRPAKYWYPTLLLNLEVKKRVVAEEWLFSRVVTKRVRGGRSDLEIVILDSHGEVVALSHHVTFVLDASRNLAGRRAEGGESKM